MIPDPTARCSFFTATNCLNQCLKQKPLSSIDRLWQRNSTNHKKMATPDDEVIKAWMTKLVPTVDLNTMTTKQFIAKLGETMGGVELSSKKAFIKKTLTEILDDIDDEEESSEEEKEEEVKPKKRASGLTAIKEITPEMARFLGKTENQAARTEIVKAIWAYVREHNLQNPNDKREIVLDDTLKQLFPCERFTMVS